MTHSERLQAALRLGGVDLGETYPKLLAALFKADMEVGKRTEFERRIHCAEDLFNLEAPSLQNRLLDYFESELGFEGARIQLKKADEGRLKVLKKIAKDALIVPKVLYGRVRRFIDGFSEFELYELNRVIFSSAPSDAFRRPQVMKFLMDKMQEGRGEDVVRYLAEGLAYRKERQDSNRTLEGFNLRLVMTAKMWTAPHVPLWLLPGSSAAAYIDRVINEPEASDSMNIDLSSEHQRVKFNNMVSQHQLKRAPAKVLAKFLSSNRNDPACLALRSEFERAAGISFDKTRPGRPRGT